ncbi:MAG: glycosyltransferase family 39 protein [Methanopyri archaeon]|nr:glycosyltransferase family 39 protein [Methanopyri archaeon]
MLVSDLLLKSSLAIGLGFGLASCGLFLWLLLFGEAGGGFAARDLIMFVILTSAVACILHRKGYKVGSLDGVEPTFVHAQPRIIRAWSLFVLIITIATFIAFALERPHGGWDAWAIWNLRARFLFRGGEHWIDGFSQDVNWSHPDYPLLIPANIARIWSYIDIDTTVAPFAVSLLLTFATIGVLGSSLSRLRGGSLALLAILIFLGSPGFISHGASQYADVPLGFFFLTTIVLLALHDTSEDPDIRYLVLAGAFAALASWTKNEGLMFVVVVVIVRALVVLPHKGVRSFIHQMIPFLAGLIPFLTVVILFKVNVSPPTDLLAAQGHLHVILKLLDPFRYITVAGALLGQLYHLGGGFISPVLILILLLIVSGIRTYERDPVEIVAPFLVLFLMLFGYSLIYVITPRELQWHLDTSLDRVLIQLWPSVVFSLFLVISGSDIDVKGNPDIE